MGEPDVHTSALHQQPKLEKEKRWRASPGAGAAAWPGLGHPAGTEAPSRPPAGRTQGAGHLVNSSVSAKGFPPPFLADLDSLRAPLVPVAYFWSGRSSRVGRGRGTHGDMDPDLGQDLNLQLCPWEPQGPGLGWGPALQIWTQNGVGYIAGPG